MGGITANSELRPGPEAATAPWLELVEDKIAEVASTVPAIGIVPAADLADILFSLVFGLELRTKLDGRPERADRLLGLARAVVAAIDPAEPIASVSQRGEQ